MLDIESSEEKGSEEERGRIALFAFRGEGACFLHAVLNVEEMRGAGMDAVLVLEGRSVTLVSEIYAGEFMVSWERVEPLVDCACLGCSRMLGVEDDVKEAGIRLEGGMSGHVSMGDYIRRGYEVITL